MSENVPPDSIEITGLSLGSVLAALFNATRPLGLGILQPKCRDHMTPKAGQEVIDQAKQAQLPEDPPDDFELRFDYVHGRPIKVGFLGCNDKTYVVGTRWFDRDAGLNAASTAISDLVKSNHKKAIGEDKP